MPGPARRSRDTGVDGIPVPMGWQGLIELRSTGELDALGEAGRAVAAALRAVRTHARAGVRLSELDELARAVLCEHAAVPLPLVGHPRAAGAAISASVNDVVAHGVADATRLTDGDLLGIDCLARVDGWCARAATTVGIGTVDPQDLTLMQTAHQALDDAIAAARPGRRIGDLSHALGVVARSGGYGIPAASGGHGIGRDPREEPSVPGEGRPGRGAPLRPGMVLLLRPVLLAGGDEVCTAEDGCTVLTGDGSRVARAGHTLAITDHGARVLTT
ncbi:type I methionyl aminopeptidase [Saccharopolyspora erythraea]|uniref:Methionine aminopeptidase n=2 Tax=Saccharopolyspora erythraea TaxID=1836 RepID=A4FFP7_SACEN|nr:type I methionyl aminopeptidase [Saccharopolyspora erythraea]CAM02872.1 methionine aminopeptidase [Saccharopolyspora erythraea NRRL 2338]